MAYMTVREAAGKWEISERLVQKYCAQGRILGAKKFGNSWGIPDHADKPLDPRRPTEKKTYSGKRNRDPFAYFLPLMQAKFPLGQCLSYIESLVDPVQKDLAYIEYYYFTGQAEKVAKMSQQYLLSSSLPARLSVSLICVFSNLTIGKVEDATIALNRIRETLEHKKVSSPQICAIKDFAIVAACVLLQLPLPQKVVSAPHDARYLPVGLRAFSLYIYAYYYCLNGEYVLSIGLVESALLMVGNEYPIVSQYLHLIAVMAYMERKNKTRALFHMKAAWELARKDQFFKAFGIGQEVLRGMLEAVVGKDSPEDYHKIMDIIHAYSAYWRAMYSQETGKKASDILSNIEYSLAMLVAKGWKNQEIADYMNMSVYTVKRHISHVMQKLEIERRQDIKQFVMR